MDIVFTCLAALRWRGLDAEERSRIVAAAAAASKGARDTPSNPEDLDLLSGYRRRRRRWLAYIELPVFSLLLVLAVFMLNGVIRPGLFALVFAVTAILSDRGLDWWERRMYGPRPVPVDPDAAL